MSNCFEKASPQQQTDPTSPAVVSRGLIDLNFKLAWDKRSLNWAVQLIISRSLLMGGQETLAKTIWLESKFDLLS